MNTITLVGITSRRRKGWEGLMTLTGDRGSPIVRGRWTSPRHKNREGETPDPPPYTPAVTLAPNAHTRVRTALAELLARPGLPNLFIFSLANLLIQINRLPAAETPITSHRSARRSAEGAGSWSVCRAVRPPSEVLPSVRVRKTRVFEFRRAFS